MKFKQSSSLDDILNRLFSPYKEQVEDVQKITNSMLKMGLIKSENDIINDHIAFRTLGIPYLGIASFEKIFLHYGYQKREFYHFPVKKLDAFWYAPPEDRFPRIFLSELRAQDLSLSARKILEQYTKDIKSDPVDALDLDNTAEVGEFFYKPLWQVPTIEDYSTLAQESEYAAWVLYNRYYLNHYTISVHDLPNGYNKLEKFNEFIGSEGMILNNSGGKIKTSNDGLLKQSSTVAKMIDAQFANGKMAKISGSYVEFAERLPLPQFKDLPKEELKRIHLRDGFESANADKIFESTYDSQTKKG